MKRKTKKATRQDRLWNDFIVTMKDINHQRNNVQPQVENPLTK